MSIPIEVIIGFSAIAGGILTLLGALLVEKIRFKFLLNRIYLAPFRKWCANIYGEFDEFWSRYLSGTTNRRDFSSVQIIDDWLALHEEIIQAPKWLAKVKKEKPKVGQKFDNLLSTIDCFWHKYEEEYNIKLKDRFDIIDIDKHIRRLMADNLWQKGRGILKRTPISKKDKEEILSYLKKRIP